MSEDADMGIRHGKRKTLEWADGFGLVEKWVKSESYIGRRSTISSVLGVKAARQPSSRTRPADLSVSNRQSRQAMAAPQLGPDEVAIHAFGMRLNQQSRLKAVTAANRAGNDGRPRGIEAL